MNTDSISHIKLTKRQITAICRKHNVDHRYSKVPPKECGVDLRIPRNPRYRHGNQLEILHKGHWHIIGWLWNLEMLSEEDIAAKIPEREAFVKAHDEFAEAYRELAAFLGEEKQGGAQ